MASRKYQKKMMANQMHKIYGMVQLNQKLYLGGNKYKNTTPLFMLIDKNGRCFILEHMWLGRTRISMCGISSFMLAIGGYSGSYFYKFCEMVMINSNKRKLLPRLRAAREWPASCVLRSRQAFCFFGSQGHHLKLNSI